MEKSLNTRFKQACCIRKKNDRPYRANAALKFWILHEGIHGIRVGENVIVGQPDLAVWAADVATVHPQDETVVAGGLFAARHEGVLVRDQTNHALLRYRTVRSHG